MYDNIRMGPVYQTRDRRIVLNISHDIFNVLTFGNRIILAMVKIIKNVNLTLLTLGKLCY